MLRNDHIKKTKRADEGVAAEKRGPAKRAKKDHLILEAEVVAESTVATESKPVTPDESEEDEIMAAASILFGSSVTRLPSPVLDQKTVLDFMLAKQQWMQMAMSHPQFYFQAMQFALPSLAPVQPMIPIILPQPGSYDPRVFGLTFSDPSATHSLGQTYSAKPSQ